MPFFFSLISSNFNSLMSLLYYEPTQSTLVRGLFWSYIHVLYTECQVIHARLRLGCSDLNSHKFNRHISSSLTTWLACTDVSEDIFFLHNAEFDSNHVQLLYHTTILTGGTVLNLLCSVYVSSRKNNWFAMSDSFYYALYQKHVYIIGQQKHE